MTNLEKKVENKTSEKTNVEKMKELAQETKKQSKALFSDDITQKVLTHKSKYKIEE